MGTLDGVLRIVLLVLAAVCFAILIFGGSLAGLPLLPLGLLLWVLADLCAGVVLPRSRSGA